MKRITFTRWMALALCAVMAACLFAGCADKKPAAEPSTPATTDGDKQTGEPVPEKPQEIMKAVSYTHLTLPTKA